MSRPAQYFRSDKLFHHPPNNLPTLEDRVTIPEIIQLTGGAAGIAALAKVATDHIRGRAASRADATRAASEASEMLFKRHAAEFERLGVRLDTLEARNNQLVAELAEKHAKLTEAEAELLENRAMLAAAQLDNNRKEGVIQRLNLKVESLQATVRELREQVKRLTEALAECANTNNSADE